MIDLDITLSLLGIAATTAFRRGFDGLWSVTVIGADGEHTHGVDASYTKALSVAVELFKAGVVEAARVAVARKVVAS